MALPPAAVFEAALEDVSRADAPAETIARTRVASPGNSPISFTLAYDPGKILPDHRYVVRARILLDDKLLFTSDTAAPVITRGSPTMPDEVLARLKTRADRHGRSVNREAISILDAAVQPATPLDAEALLARLRATRVTLRAF
jgi:uncharacterized lipoprotein YbaY